MAVRSQACKLGNILCNEKGGKTNKKLKLKKKLPLPYHHSHFLAATFTSFFKMAFFRAAHFFTVGLFWIRFVISLKVF